MWTSNLVLDGMRSNAINALDLAGDVCKSRACSVEAGDVVVVAPGSQNWLRRYNTTNDIWEILFSNLSSSVQHTHHTPLICLQPAAPGYFQTIHFQSEDHIRELRPPTHYRPDIKVTIYFCSLDRIIFPDRPAISSEVVKTLNSDEELLKFVLYWRLSQ